MTTKTNTTSIKPIIAQQSVPSATTTASSSSSKNISLVDDLADDIIKNSPRVRSNGNSNTQQRPTAKHRKKKPTTTRRGFGLLQWQRLVSSSTDLAQRKGAGYRKNIPWDEIKEHNQPHDCWMVLKGIVYNIGPYLAYHPGGIEILNKVLGEDCTELFDKYHRWVSIDGLVGTLAIGSVCETTTTTTTTAMSDPHNQNTKHALTSLKEEEGEEEEYL